MHLKFLLFLYILFVFVLGHTIELTEELNEVATGMKNFKAFLSESQEDHIDEGEIEELKVEEKADYYKRKSEHEALVEEGKELGFEVPPFEANLKYSTEEQYKLEEEHTNKIKMDTPEKITLENFLAERYSIINEEDKVDNFPPDAEIEEEKEEKKEEVNEFMVEGGREGAEREEPMLASKKQQKRAVAKRQQQLKLKKQQKSAGKGVKGKGKKK